MTISPQGPRSLWALMALVLLWPGLALASPFHPPLTIELSPGPLPRVGDILTMAITMTSRTELIEAHRALTLSPGLVVVSGQSTWTGPLSPSDPLTQTIRVQVTRPGPHDIKAELWTRASKAITWRDRRHLRFTSSDEGATLATAPLGPVPASLHLLQVVPKATKGLSQVQGSVLMWDRDNKQAPFVNAQIELYYQDGTQASEGMIDDRGNFALTYAFRPGVDSGFLLIRTRTEWDNGAIMVVTPGDPQSHYQAEVAIPLSQNSLVLGQIDLPSDHTAPAYWLHQDLNQAYSYLLQELGPEGAAIMDVPVDWAPDNTAWSHYSPGRNIYITAEHADDPGTVWHEMGHHIYFRAGHDYFPYTNCPNPHYFTEEESTTCAFTEGWASFFGVLVGGRGVMYSSGEIDIEGATWGEGEGSSRYPTGDDVEIWVTAALFDLIDDGQDGVDHHTMPFAQMIAELGLRLKTLRELWDEGADFAMVHDTGLRALFQNTVVWDDVPLPEDPFEENDSSADAAPLGPGVHELLLCQDHDWYQVELSSPADLFVGLETNPGASLVTLEVVSPEGETIYHRGAYVGSLSNTVPSVGPGTVLLHVYADGPNFYELTVDILSCDDDQDGSCEPEDCDDQNPDVGPHGTEIIYNGLDDDCDPSTPDDDLDGDGYGHISDCDDTRADVNILRREIPYNGLDDDCDPSTPDDDLDGDGWLRAEDCDDGDDRVNPGVTEVPYNGRDDDCDPLTPDDDLDGDDWPGSQDCDDGDDRVNPDATEVPHNGLDDDCNPDTFDGDGDGDGWEAGPDCDDGDDRVNPGVTEVPYNGRDDDCDPLTPDDDLDGDGWPRDQDCDDGDDRVNPGATEIPYNGRDDDCNVATPDDDLDGDNWVGHLDCDDGDGQIHPGATEVEGDGLDNDCDPSTPDSPDPDADGPNGKIQDQDGGPSSGEEAAPGCDCSLGGR